MSNQWYDIDSWQWTDDDTRQWGFGEIADYVGLYQIWTDDQYVYAATTSGLDVIDIETEQRISFATNSDGYTTVWSDDDNVFIGSSSAGIKILSKLDIGPTEIVTALSDYTIEPDITSDEIKYIHGNVNKLICCTVEGIDIIRRDSHYITHTTITGAQKCFVTTDYDYYYYTVSGTSSVSGVADPWYIYRLNGNTGDWNNADIIYTTGSGFLNNATCLTDFYVTEHTSVSGADNTLFIATDAGVYVYDEGSAQYDIYTTVS